MEDLSIFWRPIFWRPILRDEEKDKKKISKTLYKTSPKKDWDQHQPWYFTIPIMSYLMARGGVRVWREKLNKTILKWESNGKVNKNNI